MQDPAAAFTAAMQMQMQMEEGVKALTAAEFREQEEEVRCPRCESTNTKFCYYNNYNLSQPRHFCKCCRRYWTKGGSLRNIPVGGSSRKAPKRPTPSNRSRQPKPKAEAAAASFTTLLDGMGSPTWSLVGVALPDTVSAPRFP